MFKKIEEYIRRFFTKNLTDDLTISNVWDYIGDHFVGIDEELLKKNELKTYKQFRKEYLELKKEAKDLKKNAKTIEFILKSIKQKYGTLTPEQAEEVIKILKKEYKL